MYQIVRVPTHHLGSSDQPDYEFGPDCLMYRTVHHPDGRSLLPEYEVQEMAVEAGVEGERGYRRSPTHGRPRPRN